MAIREGSSTYPQRRWNENRQTPNETYSNYSGAAEGALRDGAKQYAYIYVKVDDDISFTFTNQHLKQNGLTVDRNMGESGETFPIGTSCSATAKVTLLKPAVDNMISSLSSYKDLAGKQARIMCTVDTTGYEQEGSTITERDFYLGYFVITDITASDTTYEIDMQDYFMYLDFSYDDMVAAGKQPTSTLFDRINTTNYYKSRSFPAGIKRWMNLYYKDNESSSVDIAKPRLYRLINNTNHTPAWESGYVKDMADATAPYKSYIYDDSRSAYYWCISRPDNATSMTMRELLGYFAGVMCLGNLFIDDTGDVNLYIPPDNVVTSDTIIYQSQVLSHTVSDSYMLYVSSTNRSYKQKENTYYYLTSNPLFPGHSSDVGADRSRFMTNGDNYRTTITQENPYRPDWDYRRLQVFEADVIGYQTLHPDCRVVLPESWGTNNRHSVLTQVSFTLNGTTHLACNFSPSNNIQYTQ